MEPFEPPKYLASLIAAVNDGAKSAQLGALAFTAIGLFLLATAFSATDEDLLLDRALTISQLGGTAVPVVFAFGLAPAVFVAAHFYTLIRYDMLAGNLRRFCDDLAVMVKAEGQDRDRCRQLLANIEFVNVLAIPRGSPASSWMFDWTVRGLLAVFPMMVLLLVQLQSLRLQNYVVSGVHHACIAADLVLLIWFFGRLRRDGSWNFLRVPLRRKVTLCWLPAAVMATDLLWLQVPEPEAMTVRMDILEYAKLGNPSERESLLERWEHLLRAFPVQPVDMILCTRAHVGCKFLTVSRRLIVARIFDTGTFVALRAGAPVDETHRASFEAASLRGRMLRFADLTESELYAADLTESDLQRASLKGTKLKNAALGGADLRGANLNGADLQGADLPRAKLQGALLIQTQLQGADLSKADLTGATLFQAHLQGVDLAEARLLATSLYGVQMQGANLFRAQLQGADLSAAQMQGDVMYRASLWNIKADAQTRFGLADLREANFDPPVGNPLAVVPSTVPDAFKQQMRERLIAKVGARSIPGSINTEDGKVLVTTKNDPAWKPFYDSNRLSSEPADIDLALADFLATNVAPISPRVAESIALQVLHPLNIDALQRPLTKLLACRLQAQVSAKQVTLVADTIERIRNAGAFCKNLSP